MNVPFVDLKLQYNNHKQAIDEAIASVIANTAFIRGKFVSAFESAYAEAYGVKHCISTGNGTDALYVILKMLGVGPGDEVITVANSWIATSEVITQCGARVVFADIEEDYFNICPDKLESAVTEKTKAVIPVHLFGHPAAIDRIRTICDQHGLFLVEDCAQAHFATYKGQRVGTFGEAAAFSFYPGKNLGAYGDAGAIITNDDDLARRCRMYANHGAVKKPEHEIEGINSRMDGMQAAILSAKLPHILNWSKKRYEHALRYAELLADIDEVVTPSIRDNSTHVFHIYCIRAKRRDELMAHLKEHGVGCALHYPTPLPFLKAYDYLGHVPEDFPVTSQYASEILSLPMYPELTDEQIRYTVDCIRDFFG